MWVFGDLACPNDRLAEDLKKELDRAGLFQEGLVVGNLEGMMFPDGFADPRKKLYNSTGVMDLFKDTHKTALTVANNHTYDYPNQIHPTAEMLEKKGITCFGIAAGSSLTHAIVKERGQEHIFVGHCWNLMTAIMPNEENDVRINDCSYEELESKVKELRRIHPDAFLTVYLHWNFDMEKLPLPAHRVYARRLIDGGVNAVIGSHAHRVNGGEVYKEGVILYGLGNFFIADGVYHDGKKFFPEVTHTTLVLDLKEPLDDSVCYWLKMQSHPEVKVELLAKERFGDGRMLRSFSPFQGMSDKEYVKYYRKHRAKSLLLPVYRTTEDSLANRLRDQFILMRIRILRRLRNYG